MKNFKYKRVENRFRWESEDMVLEFSDPSIQGFSDYTKLESEKEIMYYYYTVKVFKKVIGWKILENDNEDDKEVVRWKLVSKRRVFDFPTIKQLKWIIEYQLKDNTMINGQKSEYSSGEIRYSKVVSTEGFACDDFYEITKVVDSKGKDFGYVVYAGTTFDLQGDLNSVGIRTPYVKRKDIEELLKCVSKFIQYSIYEHNKYVSIQKEMFAIKDNKIYEYTIGKDGVNKNEIESIYIIGDNLEITTVVDNKEICYDGVMISKIEGESIFLDSGDIISLESVAYMCDEQVDEKLRYGESEIAEDFISIMSSDEKEEFIKLDVENILKKYKSAIINRTWMCMDEHEFNIDYSAPNRVGAVIPVVKNVINRIKAMLTLNKLR